ncbi:MAG TPA: hypothetical protein VMU50_19175 [Polyangia bacterium]|nr:hypothetical protein [Polyangia bacterium]
MKRVLAPLIVGALLLVTGGMARADVVAVYLQGQGGLSSASAENGSHSGSPSSGVGVLGLQLGARLLLFEGYVNYDRFGEDVAVSRAILGLRGGFGTSSLRLVLRGGVGGMVEQGGALTVREPGVPNRRGVVARAGAALEGRLASALWLGAGIDSEVFYIAPGSLFGSNAVQGSDILASLHLLFELGF